MMIEGGEVLYFVLFIWLLLLTIGYFSIRTSHRYLIKQIGELQHQLQKLRERSESMQEGIEEETISFPNQQDEKRITGHEKPVLQEDQEPVIPDTEVIQETPSAERQEKPEPIDETMQEKEVDEQRPSKPAQVAQVDRQPEPISRSKKKSRTRIDWELLIGGRWLNRIGALAVILGLIFFIKYAFDHQLISNPMKVIIVIMAGLLLLGGGRYFHRKQLPVFAQGLIGAGIATLYLAAYAAHNFYHLIDGTFAFLWIFLVTLLAFQQALSYNAFAISLLGWCGGYLTPFFVHVNAASTTGLFSYLAFLSLSMIVMAIKKRNWSLLYHLTVVATYVIFFLYLFGQYDPSEWLLRIGFLSIFWAIFYGYELYTLTRHIQWLIAQVTMASIHALFLYVGLVCLLEANHSDWILEALIIAGLLYLAPLIVLSRRRKKPQFIKPHVIRHGLTFCLFINLAPIYHWERFELILVWIIQTALMIGWATHKRLQWLINYLLGFLVIVSFTLIIYSVMDDLNPPVFNLRFLSFVGLTAVFLLGAIRQPRKYITQPILHVAWAIVLWMGFSYEIYKLKDYIQHMTAGAYVHEVDFLAALVFFTSWMIYSLFLARVAIWKQIHSLRIASWVLLMLGTIYLSLVAIADPTIDFTVVFWSRMPIFLVAILVLVLHYRWHRNQHPWFALASLYSGIILGFEWMTLQIHDYFTHQIIITLGENDPHALLYTKWNMMWIAWILYAVPLIGYAWRRNIPSLIKSSTIFYGLCVLGVWIHSLRFQPLEQFVPVLNFRFLMVLVAVLVTYYFYSIFRKHDGQKRMGFIFVLLALCFTLINVEINDYFRHQLFQLSPSQTWEAESIRFTHPLSLATIWVLFSLPLMWLGLRHQRKWVQSTAWIVLGIGVFFVMLLSVTFTPILSFTPLLNQRSLFFFMVVAVLFVHLAWFKKGSSVRLVGSIVIALLLFELLTVEINDLFRLLIQQDQQSIHELLNLKQLTFSVAWILYAIGLFAIGVWRKFPSLRWIAIGLIGISIFKIFLFDLAFLETLYRIFLFMGLGMVLLFISYIYQRYKHLFILSNHQRDDIAETEEKRRD